MVLLFLIKLSEKTWINNNHFHKAHSEDELCSSFSQLNNYSISIYLHNFPFSKQKQPTRKPPTSSNTTESYIHLHTYSFEKRVIFYEHISLKFSAVCLGTQSCLTLCDHQAPLPLGFSRQEYWSGLPCPSPFSVIVMYNNNPCLLHTHITGPCPAFFIFTHLYISSFTHSRKY